MTVGPSVAARVACQLATASPIVSSPDARDLRAFFARSGFASVFESPTGRILDLAELYSGGTSTCRKCGGSGFLSSTRARRLRGVPPSADATCPACRGLGFLWKRSRHAHGSVTARPTGSSARGSWAQTGLDDADLHLLGSVSRRLADAAEFVPIAPDVLCAWYSPGGGNRIALWRFTEAGRRMLRRNKLDLDVDRFFENERAAAAKKHDRERLQQFAAADTEARELLRVASKAWNRTAVRRLAA